MKTAQIYLQFGHWEDTRYALIPFLTPPVLLLPAPLPPLPPPLRGFLPPRPTTCWLLHVALFPFPPFFAPLLAPLPLPLPLPLPPVEPRPLPELAPTFCPQGEAVATGLYMYAPELGFKTGSGRFVFLGFVAVRFVCVVVCVLLVIFLCVGHDAVFLVCCWNGGLSRNFFALFHEIVFRLKCDVIK